MRTSPRFRFAALFVVLALALAVVPQFARTGRVSAQGTTATAVATATTSTGLATLTICGTATQFTAASASGAGTLMIGGLNFTVGTTANLSTSNLTVGNAYCATLTVDAAGQIATAAVFPTTVTGAALNICGLVSAYTAATTTSAGTITIGGQTFNIASSTVFNGPSITSGGTTPVCLSANVAVGALTSGSFSVPLAASRVASGGKRVGTKIAD